MFVPVACSRCGKPFQVPEAAVGSPTVCPWCRDTVLALPVGLPATAPPPSAPLSSVSPSSAPLSSAPLSSPVPSVPPTATPSDSEHLALDDSPDDAPPRAPASLPPAALPTATPGRRFPLGVVVLAPVVLLVTGVLTVGVLRYRQGYLTALEWRTVSPDGGNCSVELLGRPTEDPDPGPRERRFVSRGWYSGTTAWVAWRELDPRLAELAVTPDAWQHFRPLFEAERDRLKVRYNGTVTKDATIRFEDPLTWELRLEYPGGRLVQRAIVAPGGQRSRVYFLGLAGHIDPEGDDARRLFASFRPSD
jgi:hypothetical protein